MDRVWHLGILLIGYRQPAYELLSKLVKTASPLSTATNLTQSPSACSYPRTLRLAGDAERH
jgi:hypothetical protein